MVSDFSHTTLRENVAAYLRNQILSGAFAQGEKINEVEIARQLNISRGPMREALRQIEQEGFVSYLPNKGCTVRSLTPESMAEVYLIRCTLESLAVRVVGGAYSAETIERMYEACSRIGTAAREKDLAGIVRYDQQAHALIVQECGLDRLYRVWSSFDGENAATYHTMNRSDLVPREFLERNHRILVDALKKGDVDESVRMIEEHYMVVPEVLYKYRKEAPGKLVSILGGPLI